MERLLNVRYPPYAGKFAQYAKMNSLKPDFDRDGKVKFRLLKFVLTLGTGSIVWGSFRAALLAAFAIAVKELMDRRAGKN